MEAATHAMAPETSEMGDTHHVPETATSAIGNTYAATPLPQEKPTAFGLEQSDRLAKLRIAMRIAAEKKPRIVKGDLRTDLARLAAEAPKDATLVIFHTASIRRFWPTSGPYRSERNLHDP
jgi:hypothetical protein